MKSPLPKVLHRVCGVPMVELVGKAMQDAGVRKPVVVYGHGGELVPKAMGEGYQYVLQAEQNGTGHATLLAVEALGGYSGPVLIAPGDTPLLTSQTFQAILEAGKTADCIVGSMVVENPSGYGRVKKDSRGIPISIIEEADASEEEKQINEVNTSIYCVRIDLLRELLPKLGSKNAKGEIYLTDIVAEICGCGGTVATYLFQDPSEVIGVNDQWQLAKINEVMRLRNLKLHAEGGVIIGDTQSISIGPNVKIGKGTTIESMTVIEGNSEIGENCNIGPMTKIYDCKIGSESVVLMSHLNRSVVGNDCRIGPYANLRPGTALGNGVKIGNYVEVKNSTVGDESSISHLSYIGDAKVGEDSNIGAGTITCNYDGFDKHLTEIGDNSFIGSNSTLVAPVKIGDGSMTAAGSVITSDVPDDSLAVGRSRQENKDGWAKRWRQGKKKNTD